MKQILKNFNPDYYYFVILQELFGDDLDISNQIPTCPKLRHPEFGVNWCDDDENDRSLCSLMCQGIGPFIY